MVSTNALSKILSNALSQRKAWVESYEDVLKFASQGVLERELLQAKEVFFAKLGRAHEMREEIYEAASQSFLEWYVFEYTTKLFAKRPAVVYLTLNLGAGEHLRAIEKALFDHWSLYEVLKITREKVVLKDLLFHQTREVIHDTEAEEFRLWRVKVGQVIQARLFELEEKSLYFFSHIWLHPSPEDQVLKRICQKRRKMWSRHHDFLLASFEAAVRSYGLQKQLKASHSNNWIYQDLWKRYAETQ